MYLLILWLAYDENSQHQCLNIIMIMTTSLCIFPSDPNAHVLRRHMLRLWGHHRHNCGHETPQQCSGTAANESSSYQQLQRNWGLHNCAVLCNTLQNFSMWLILCKSWSSNVLFTPFCWFLLIWIVDSACLYVNLIFQFPLVNICIILTLPFIFEVL